MSVHQQHPFQQNPNSNQILGQRQQPQQQQANFNINSPAYRSFPNPPPNAFNSPISPSPLRSDHGSDTNGTPSPIQHTSNGPVAASSAEIAALAEQFTQEILAPAKGVKELSTTLGIPDVFPLQRPPHQFTYDFEGKENVFDTFLAQNGFRNTIFESLNVEQHGSFFLEPHQPNFVENNEFCFLNYFELSINQ